MQVRKAKIQAQFVMKWIKRTNKNLLRKLLCLADTKLLSNCYKSKVSNVTNSILTHQFVMNQEELVNHTSRSHVLKENKVETRYSVSEGEERGFWNMTGVPVFSVRWQQTRKEQEWIWRRVDPSWRQMSLLVKSGTEGSNVTLQVCLGRGLKCK